MGFGHKAYDAELAATAYGLIHLIGLRETGRSYAIFTDSTAAMARATSDAPGPGQGTAIRIIELAQRIVDQGSSITIRWAPAHGGVEGNGRADQKAEMASQGYDPALQPRLPPAQSYRAGYQYMEGGNREQERWPKGLSATDGSIQTRHRALATPDYQEDSG